MTSRSKPQQRQLTLNVQLRDDATFENFLQTPIQQPLLGSLAQQLEHNGEAIIFLHGPADTGRTHLLQAACHAAGSGALYLPLAELGSGNPDELLRGVDSLRLVCLDDLQSVLGDESWESALFHLFNRARENNCRLLVAADASPRALSLQLADLRSRLSWGVVYHLPAVSDAQRRAVLSYRAARRGLQLPEEVSRFIVNRAPRALGELLSVLDNLDASSLVEQRAISIPFVKKIMQW